MFNRGQLIDCHATIRPGTNYPEQFSRSQGGEFIGLFYLVEISMSAYYGPFMDIQFVQVDHPCST